MRWQRGADTTTYHNQQLEVDSANPRFCGFLVLKWRPLFLLHSYGDCGARAVNKHIKYPCGVRRILRSVE